MTLKLAFLGLGVMGGPMAANLATSGYRLAAWNRTPSKPGADLAAAAGAKICESINEAILDADVIFTCVGGSTDVEEILLGEDRAKLLKAGALVVDSSTIGPKAATHLAEKLSDLNVRFMDAPVSGGDTGAKNGTLTFMVGASPEDFEECLPLLQTMGKSITRCGEVGSGQSMKLCNQLLCAVHKVAFCEALQLAVSKGLDPQTVVDVCGSGAAGSWVLNNFASRGVAGDFSTGFMVKHMLKDIRLILEACREESLDLRAIARSLELFERVAALEGGTGGELGTQAIMRVS